MKSTDLWKLSCISENESIKSALKVIDKSGLKTAVVIDEKFIFKGIITDGDIRRAILKNLDLECNLIKILNRTPFTISPHTPKDKTLSLMLKHKYHQIPVVDDNGTIVGVETLENISGPQKHSNTVVIMAGGRGKRLYPLTKDHPKPMIKVGNKPILKIIIENLVKQGFEKFYISVNYKAQTIMNFFGDGSELGITINYLMEKDALGTAGSLSLLPQPTEDQPFIVMNGDLLTNLDFNKLLDFHQSQEAFATMAIIEEKIHLPYGVVEVEKYKIKEIHEKPTNTFMINSGIYVFHPGVLNYVPKDTSYDIPSLFEKLIKENLKTTAFPLFEYWRDIGRHNDLRDANNDLESF